jgi:hypothetical protein
MNKTSILTSTATAQEVAYAIVCDASLAALAATGANPSSINIQVAMAGTTDRAIAMIEQRDGATRQATIKAIRCRAREVWAGEPFQLELDLGP